MNKQLQLETPGAGLPFWERALLNIVFKSACLVVSDRRALRLFKKESIRSLKLVDSMDPITGSTESLIPRIRGIEDSSRNWSCYMVLQHLVIVNARIIEQIECLCNGNVPTDTVDIADFKPAPETNETAVARFLQSTREFADRIDALGHLNSQLRYRHPWFGELNSHQWLCLSAAHMQIHRKQIQKIKKQIARNA